MEALSGSASLDDFVAKVEATDWAGCDARAFARAATVKLVTLSKSEKYKNDFRGLLRGVSLARPKVMSQRNGR